MNLISTNSKFCLLNHMSTKNIQYCTVQLSTDINQLKSHGKVFFLFQNKIFVLPRDSVITGKQSPLLITQLLSKFLISKSAFNFKAPQSSWNSLMICSILLSSEYHHPVHKHQPGREGGLQICILW